MEKDSRRVFVRTVLLSTAWMAGTGGTFRLRLAGELVSSPGDNRGILNVQPSEYSVLNQPGGSVRLGFNPIRSNHQPDGTLHPLLINRLENGELLVLSAECPHGSCAVRTFSKSSNTHVCPCHASRFRIDGSRVSGPAPFGLERLDAEICPDGSLDILVPRLRFSITSKVLASGPSRLMRIDFPARRKVDYQVVYKADLSGAWERVSFALNEFGVIGETVLTGEGLLASVFVDPPANQGAYAVQIRYEEL